MSATNGSWGSAVAAGTWADDSTEKTVSFPSTPGAFLRIRYLDNYCYVAEHNVAGAVTSTSPPPTGGGGGSVIPQGQMSVVSASSDGANKAKVLDGNSTTMWGANGSGPHEMVLALGGSYDVSEFRYLPFSWTKCTQYEVYVSATNGNWGSAVAAGTWANDPTEKTASFPPTPGAFLRIRYLNSYCYVAEHNVAGVPNQPPPTLIGIMPTAVTVPVESQQAFTATNGVAPYTYSVLTDTTGGASVNATTGVYTAGPLEGSSTVRVTDANLDTADAVVTVPGAASVIPQGQMTVVSASSDAGNKAKVLV